MGDERETEGGEPKGAEGGPAATAPPVDGVLEASAPAGAAADSASERANESPSPPPSPAVPSGPPRAPGWATIAALALIPFAGVVGALAHPEHESGHVPDGDVLGGLTVGAFLGLLAAVPTRLAHRWATEWLALLLGGSLWVLGGVVEDLRHRSAPGSWDSAASYHQLVVSHALEIANLCASTSGVALAYVAAVLAILLESRRDGAQRPLSRAWLVASLVPLGAVALALGIESGMPGFVAAALVLALFALVRVASRVRVDDARSVGLAFGAVAAAAAGLAATASGACLHGLFLVMHTASSGASPGQLASVVGREEALSIGATTVVLATFPPLALFAALDARGASSTLPRRAIALSLAALVTLLWIDGRNTLDVRRHVEGYLRTTGAVDFRSVPRDFHPATIPDDDHVYEGFVLVPLHGAVRYHGATLASGVRGVPALAHDGELPPVLFDGRARADDAMALFGPLRGRGVSTLRLAARAEETGRLTSVRWGPMISSVPPGFDPILLFAIVTARGDLEIASTAGERIDIPNDGGLDLETFRTRLEERRAAEPNRRDIIVAPESGVSMQQLLSVLSVVRWAGFDEVGASRASAL